MAQEIAFLARETCVPEESSKSCRNSTSCLSLSLHHRRRYLSFAITARGWFRKMSLSPDRDRVSFESYKGITRTLVAKHSVNIARQSHPLVAESKCVVLMCSETCELDCDERELVCRK